jgi:hypothetical protein
MFFLLSGSYFNHFTRGPKRPGVSAFRAKTSQRYQGKVQYILGMPHISFICMILVFIVAAYRIPIPLKVDGNEK